ncbi:MAG: hypothetical protein ACRD2G_17820 [Terriglobia bacterium]
MKTAIVLSILSAALFVTGCLRRQTGPRLVYTPPPAAAPKPNLPQQTHVLIIEAPAPPPAAESTPKAGESEVSSPAPKPPRKHRTAQAGINAAGAEPETTEPAAADAPPLLPERSLQQQIDLEKQIGDLRSAVRLRIARLSRMNLSTEDRKALQDARLFLTEADRAMRENDLQQALNLAQKADLLISAVEKRH